MWSRGALFALTLLAPLAACKRQNAYVAPPPAQVGVAQPLRQPFTPYLETTGNTVAYTQVNAPFDGLVSEHLASVGELVGQSGPTKLATLVQLDPIYVNFNVSEQDVLRIREMVRALGIKPAEAINKIAVEVGLMTEK